MEAASGFRAFPFALFAAEAGAMRLFVVPAKLESHGLGVQTSAGGTCAS